MPDEVTDPTHASPQAIVYRRGVEEFRGWADLPGMFLLLARAALAALIAAAIVCLPLLFGGYVLCIFAQFLLGIFLGGGVSRAFRMSRVRNRAVAVQVFIFAVLIALILPQAAVYLYDIVRLSLQAMHRFGLGFFSAYRWMVSFHSTFLISKTRHGGLLGSILFHFQNEAYAGFAFVQTIVTIFIAWKISARQLVSPFCESCGNWMRPPINAAVVHVDLGDYLVEAVQTGDAEKALAVTRTAAGVPLGAGCVVARLFRCKTCDAQRVDVIRKGFGRRSTKETVMLKPAGVTPEFVTALRSDPVEAVEEEDTPDEEAPAATEPADGSV
jgi:hypothetical protein